MYIKEKCVNRFLKIVWVNLAQSHSLVLCVCVFVIPASELRCKTILVLCLPYNHNFENPCRWPGKVWQPPTSPCCSWGTEISHGLWYCRLWSFLRTWGSQESSGRGLLQWWTPSYLWCKNYTTMCMLGVLTFWSPWLKYGPMWKVCCFCLPLNGHP